MSDVLSEERIEGGLPTERSEERERTDLAPNLRRESAFRASLGPRIFDPGSGRQSKIVCPPEKHLSVGPESRSKIADSSERPLSEKRIKTEHDISPIIPAETLVTLIGLVKNDRGLIHQDEGVKNEGGLIHQVEEVKNEGQTSDNWNRGNETIGTTCEERIEGGGPQIFEERWIAKCRCGASEEDVWLRLHPTMGLICSECLYSM